MREAGLGRMIYIDSLRVAVPSTCRGENGEEGTARRRLVTIKISASLNESNCFCCSLNSYR